MKKVKNKTPITPPIFMVIFCTIIFSVITFILEPLLVMTNADILLGSTPLPAVLDMICELCDILVFSICYSLISFAAVTRSAKSSLRLFGIYAAACTLRRGLVLAISFVIYSSVDTLDLLSVGSALAFECILALIITMISVYVSSKSNAARVTDGMHSTNAFNFDKVFSKDNPLLICTLISTVIMAITRISMRIISDIDYGAPTSLGEILIMVVAYIFDILLSALFYSIAWLFLAKFQSLRK